MKEAEESRKQAAVMEEKIQAKQLAERKANFSKEYEHVWIGGDTETKIVQWTMQDSKSVEVIAAEIFEENLVSDCEVVHEGMSRQFLRDGKQVILDGEY